jgi:hypothetical protein
MKRSQTVAQVRWDLALRYRLIETVAWWEGRLMRISVNVTAHFANNVTDASVRLRGV